MRYLLSGAIPPFTRVLLVESGSRAVLDKLVPALYEKLGAEMEIDLLTCYAAEPAGFRGRVYRVNDYPNSTARGQLFRDLQAREYSLAGILCTGEPIMTKWKWATAARIPAKLFLINENADFMFVDWTNRASLRHLALVRSGLTGGSALTAFGRMVSFPFSLLFLLFFAASVHGRRFLRSLSSSSQKVEIP